MKSSKYNYMVEDGDRTIFLNGITELFFEVPTSRRDNYEAILSEPDEYTDVFRSFIDKMRISGFIIENETDESELVEKKYHRLRNESEYRLMILPTYECNLRCWYCTQDHQDISISEETIVKIKDLLRNAVQRPEIKRIQLSWFGGEPLLGYDTVVSLTDYSRQLCEKHGKTFSCDITTNGTLLNRERIENLRAAGLTFYQITIDGTKETHDNIKTLPHGSAFERALENINIIAETTRCTLRFNYTSENLKPEEIISDLRSRIRQECRHNISFLIYKVWQTDRETIDAEKVDRLVLLSNMEGIVAKLPTLGLCYADARNFHCIFPNGRVEKCDNEPPEAGRGTIVDGDVVWNTEVSSHIPAFEHPLFPCRECRYVPVCWGPCVAKRDSMLRATGKGHCQYVDPATEIRHSLLNLYKNTRNTSFVAASKASEE